MEEVARFVVPDEPVSAVRPRVSFQARRVYDPKKNVEWKHWVMLSFEQALPEFEPIARGVPVRLSGEFVFERKKGHYGTGRNAHVLKDSAPRHHVVKPDVDNLLKIVKDALKHRAWDDDSQVSSYGTITKRYVEEGEQPHTLLILEVLTTV